MPAQLALLLGRLPCLGLKCPQQDSGLSEQGEGKPVVELRLPNWVWMFY